MAVKTFSDGVWKDADSHVTVAVFVRRKYARVDWDFFRLPEENDSIFKAHAEELSRAVESIYFESANDHSEFNGNGLVGQMEGLLIDKAELAAQRISALFDQYVIMRKTSGY